MIHASPCSANTFQRLATVGPDRPRASAIRLHSARGLIWRALTISRSSSEIVADSFNIGCLVWVSNNLRASVIDGHNVVTRITTGESAPDSRKLMASKTAPPAAAALTRRTIAGMILAMALIESLSGVTQGGYLNPHPARAGTGLRDRRSHHQRHFPDLQREFRRPDAHHFEARRQLRVSPCTPVVHGCGDGRRLANGAVAVAVDGDHRRRHADLRGGGSSRS